jgi:uncharacterized protein
LVYSEYTFIADVHLGKLAKLLRMLGFDTAYNNTYNSAQLVLIAAEQNRILLSRNKDIATMVGARTLVISSEKPIEQLKQVIESFHLHSLAIPFTRCLVCNGIVKRVRKEAIQDRLEQNTNAFYNEFWQCTSCRRIYWRGSHYERMKNWLNMLDQSPG